MLLSRHLNDPLRSAMKKLLILLLISIPGWLFAQSRFEKAAFYEVMKSGTVREIDQELAALTDSSLPNKAGYEGVLLMKKADLVSMPAEKLKFFKQGRIKMETALLDDPTNAEFHFLRLTIQEHAPKIVKYHSDIAKDKEYIQSKFNELSPAVQHAISDYAKHSKVLKSEDLQ